MGRDQLELHCYFKWVSTLAISSTNVLPILPNFSTQYDRLGIFTLENTESEYNAYLASFVSDIRGQTKYGGLLLRNLLTVMGSYGHISKMCPVIRLFLQSRGRSSYNWTTFLSRVLMGSMLVSSMSIVGLILPINDVKKRLFTPHSTHLQAVFLLPNTPI